MTGRVTRRVCAEPGCPTLTTTPRCPTHQAATERRRDTPTTRGYNADHRAARRHWAPLVATGTIPCRRCGQPIPGPDFDLGHPDKDCPAPRAPEHPACNRAAAGRSNTR